MSIRGLSVARVIGKRGAGLGNELVPWAKAALVSQELGVRLARPSWALHPEKYPEAWGWRRPSLAVEYVAGGLMPSLVISEEMYRATGLVDYGSAVRAIVEERSYGTRRSPVRIVSEGMWGGYQAIEGAKPFLWMQLLSAKGVPGALAQHQRRVGDRVSAVIHMRGGDFVAEPPSAGQFNKRLPLEWYLGVGEQIRKSLGADVDIAIVTDSPKSSDVAKLVSATGAVIECAPWVHSAPMADLAILASADLSVCSVSSFSMAAAFLSDDAPYIWYKPQLNRQEGGLNIWGHEGTHPTAQSLVENRGEQALPRGLPMDVGDSLPESLREHLTMRAGMRYRGSDLLYYGNVQLGKA